jgi:hypothetical protein
MLVKQAAANPWDENRTAWGFCGWKCFETRSSPVCLSLRHPNPRLVQPKSKVPFCFKLNRASRTLAHSNVATASRSSSPQPPTSAQYMPLSVF